jgi:hypothetical protein
MGIVCEFYVVEDKMIDEFLAKPSEFDEYVEEKYVDFLGQFHHEEENTFYCDKAWDIARFLFLQNHPLLGNLLGKELENVEGKSYLKAEKAKKIYHTLSQITSRQIEEAYNETNIQRTKVYSAGKFTKQDHWDYILQHIETFQKAFKKAAENDAGIIVSRG